MYAVYFFKLPSIKLRFIYLIKLTVKQNKHYILEFSKMCALKVKRYKLYPQSNEIKSFTQMYLNLLYSV